MINNYRYTLYNGSSFYNSIMDTVVDSYASYTLSLNPSEPYIVIESDIGQTGNVLATVSIDGVVVLDASMMELNTQFYFFDTFFIPTSKIEVSVSVNSITEGIYASMSDIYIIPGSPSSISATSSNGSKFYQDSKIHVEWDTPTGALNTSGNYCIAIYKDGTDTPIIPNDSSLPTEMVNGYTYIYLPNSANSIDINDLSFLNIGDSFRIGIRKVITENNLVGVEDTQQLSSYSECPYGNGDMSTYYMTISSHPTGSNVYIQDSDGNFKQAESVFIMNSSGEFIEVESLFDKSANDNFIS